jgi:large subunit ribosomal protein L6
MSRIGNRPIQIPSGVEIKIDKALVSVKGPKGQLDQKISNENILFDLAEDNLSISRKNDDIETKSFHGLYRALISNMVTGVTDGFSKKLQLIGTGYRAQLKGKSLELSLGFSHSITVEPIGENKFSVEDQTLLTIEGPDKEHVGRQAAKIRILRKPNPFTGKGIKYDDEVIRRKSGKAAVGAGE